jgi:hypothetical protein
MKRTISLLAIALMLLAASPARSNDRDIMTGLVLVTIYDSMCERQAFMQMISLAAEKIGADLFHATLKRVFEDYTAMGNAKFCTTVKPMLRQVFEYANQQTRPRN